MVSETYNRIMSSPIWQDAGDVDADLRSLRVDILTFFEVVKNYFCGKDKEFNSVKFNSDFWWMNRAITLVDTLCLDPFISNEDFLFIRDYLSTLFEYLIKDINLGRFMYAVYAHFKQGKFVGYKIYRKRSTGWVGLSYKKRIV